VYKRQNQFKLREENINFRTILHLIGGVKFVRSLIPMESSGRNFINRALAPRRVFNFRYLWIARLRSRIAFDESIYAAQLDQLNLPKTLGFTHFDSVGWRMRLNPNSWFNTHYYLENNPDVESLGINPLEHYFSHGKHEGRAPNYLSSSKALIRVGTGTTVEISDTSDEVTSRIFIKAGKNCRIAIKGIEVIETSLTISMADNCILNIEPGQRIRGPLVINLNESSSVNIGSDGLFANSQIWTSDSHSVIDANTGNRLNAARDVEIGKNVLIGSGAMILKGSQIGSDSIVGALSVVSGSFPNNTAIAGNPAKVVKENVAWTEEII
jgi:acetyltransferase-like isoleucine patch superfamily enzyme